MIRRSPPSSPLFFAWALALAAALTHCSLEERDRPLKLRAHDVNKRGVFHAEPLLDATRYCAHCHGENLVGGKKGEPSCLQCHGENWPAREPERSDAPADHLVQLGGYRHHSAYQNPQGTCNVAGCHGSEFKGDLAVGTPSCLLCHDEVRQ